MTALDLPTAARAPLARGRGDGVGRLARRTQRGQGGRRTLVVVLVALAVALGVLAGAWTSTLARTDVENVLQDRFGPADLVVEDPSGSFRTSDEVPLTAEQEAWLEAHPGPVFEGVVDERPVATTELEELLALLPAGAEVLRYRHDGLYGYGSEQTVVTNLDVTAPLGSRTFDTGGRTTPLTGREGLASPALLARYGAAVGATVPVPGVGDVEVVGTLTRAAARSSEVLVVAPDREIERPGANDAVRVALPVGTEITTMERLRELVDRDLQAVQSADPSSFVLPPEVASAEEFVAGQEDVTSVATLVGTVVTGFAVTIAALVAACAFAVGVRRRLRELGMLGAVGATPAQLARLVRREGLLIGLLGAGAGLVLGVGFALGGQPLLERLVDRDVTIGLPLVAVVPPVLLGGLAAMLAAWWPARTAARVPVVAALAGRVPTGRVPSWLPLASLVVTAGGVGMFVWGLRLTRSAVGWADQGLPLLAASIVATLGVAGLGLPVLALGGRLADRLPVLPRMALRDAARRRSRSGAAIAALVPVLALPIAGLVVMTGDEPGLPGDATWVDPVPSTVAVVGGPWTAGGRPVPPDGTVVDAVAAALPTTGGSADVVELGLPRSWPAAARWTADGGPVPTSMEVAYPSTGLALATPELLDLLGLPADAVGDGEVLVLPRNLYERAPAADALVSLVGGEGGSATLAELPAVVRTDADTPGYSGALITPTTAADLGLVEVGRPVALALERPLTEDESMELWRVTGDRGHVATVPTPSFWSTDLGRFTASALVGLAVLAVVCVVAGMTSALAATESDDDLRRAVALGAEPRTRRRFHGVQAWWHAAVAGVLGTGLGLVIGHVVVDESDFLVVDPRVWPAAAGWALLAPVAVGFVIGLAVRSSPVEAPRRRTA